MQISCTSNFNNWKKFVTMTLGDQADLIIFNSISKSAKQHKIYFGGAKQ